MHPQGPSAHPTLPKAQTKDERVSVSEYNQCFYISDFNQCCTKLNNHQTRFQAEDKGVEKGAGHYSYSVTRTILSQSEWDVSSTSARFSPRCPYTLSPFQTLRSDSAFPLHTGAVSEVVEVEFPWQTFIKHQHWIYKYILISIHCKISPTMSRAWKQVGGLHWQYFLD